MGIVLEQALGITNCVHVAGVTEVHFEMKTKRKATRLHARGMNSMSGRWGMLIRCSLAGKHGLVEFTMHVILFLQFFQQ